MRKLVTIISLSLLTFPAMAQDGVREIQNGINHIVDDMLNQTMPKEHHKAAQADASASALNLTNSNLSNQKYAGRNLAGSEISNSEIKNVNFNGADFTGSSFTNVDFVNCTFLDVKFDKADISNTNFDNSDVRGASFAGADLTNVDFLNGAKMYGVDLSRATLSNVSYDEADFNTPIEVTSNVIVERLNEAPKDTRYHSKPSIDLAIQFEFDSDKLTGNAWDQLKELSTALKSDSLKDLSFTIEGHTDAKGSDDYNKDLSYRRAASVRKVLADSFGISNDRLDIQGYGEERPIADNNTDYGRALNRRVTIATK